MDQGGDESSESMGFTLSGEYYRLLFRNKLVHGLRSETASSVYFQFLMRLRSGEGSKLLQRRTSTIFVLRRLRNSR